MKTLIVVFMSAMALLSVAEANPYDSRSIVSERAQIARQREAVNARERRISKVVEHSAAYDRLIRGFIRAHRGLAKEGVCSVRLMNCATDDYCESGQPQNVSLDAIGGQMLWVSHCSVVLNDGLACTVFHPMTWGPKPATNLEAGCYDENSNYRDLVYPGKSVKSAPKTRHAR